MMREMPALFIATLFFVAAVPAQQQTDTRLDSSSINSAQVDETVTRLMSLPWDVRASASALQI
jgi:hypothetical protein